MTFMEWLMRKLRGHPTTKEPSREQVDLSARQVEVADRLAKMKGTTRDAVLNEAYRRADSLLARRQ